MDIKQLCLSSAYLAPIIYYSFLIKHKSALIECHDNYSKQTYRNRTTILDASGPTSLTIPVVNISGEKTKMKDLRISDHDNWQHIHWNAIKSSYNSSPFFEYYQDDFYAFYHTKYKFLFDFNEEMRETILKSLNVGDVSVCYTNEYIDKYPEDVLDLRNKIHPKLDWKMVDSQFSAIPYYQVFKEKNDFVPNLSIIDLLFNMGNESLLVLLKSI